MKYYHDKHKPLEYIAFWKDIKKGDVFALDIDSKSRYIKTSFMTFRVRRICSVWDSIHRNKTIVVINPFKLVLVEESMIIKERD